MSSKASSTGSAVTRARPICATVSSNMPCADSCKRAVTKACDQALKRAAILLRTPGHCAGTSDSARYCSSTSNTRRAMARSGRNWRCKCASLNRKRSAMPSAAPRNETTVATSGRLAICFGQACGGLCTWLAALSPFAALSAVRPSIGVRCSAWAACVCIASCNLNCACGCRCGAKLGSALSPAYQCGPRACTSRRALRARKVAAHKASRRCCLRTCACTV